MFGIEGKSEPIASPLGGWKRQEYDEVRFNTDHTHECKVSFLPHTIDEAHLVAQTKAVRLKKSLLTLNDQRSYCALVKLCDKAKSADEKGRVLEQLIAALFQTVPGLSLSDSRVRTETEEIDLVLENHCEDPRLKREGAIILVECKNWSSKCGKNEFVLFKEKIRNRKGRCTIGFLFSWNGFAGTITKEMLRESQGDPLIVPIESEQIRKAVLDGSFWSLLRAAWDKATMI
jgi:hypothetical protein